MCAFRLGVSDCQSKPIGVCYTTGQSPRLLQFYRTIITRLPFSSAF
ncbi:hypothetical protein RSAG8_08387, partial [Rhizoctonia solani AG-8 WAC10335]